MDSIEECAVMARQAVSSGTAIPETLELIVEGLGDNLSPFALVGVLRMAFGIPVAVLREVENWNRLSDNGTKETTEVIDMIAPWFPQN